MKRRDYPPVLFLRPFRTCLAAPRRHPRRTIAVIWIVLSIISAKSISGIDLNNDGMSDVWQQKYSVPSADANLDYDGIGLTNSQKSLLGLDPRDPNSRFHLEIVRDAANNQLRLRLDTILGKLYQLESSSDLQNWVSFNSTLTGTGGTVEIVQSLPGAQMFFRARCAGDIDADGDGLTAWEEHELGTRDNSSDSDGDGMPDAWEVTHGLNPNLNDANSDSDGDGTSNIKEFQRGTDPSDFYNGRPPFLGVYAGGDQRGDPGTVLPVPISVIVNYNTYNAPLTFSVVQGHALLAPDNAGLSTPQSTLSIRSTGRAIGVYGSSYVAQVWVYLPSIANEVSVIRATAVTGANAVSVNTTAVTIDPSLSAPANFEAIATSATTVEVHWAAITSATTLQVSTDGGATWSNVAVAGPGVSRVIVTGLQPNTSVSFRSFSGGENPTVTVDGGTVAMPGVGGGQSGGGGSAATASLAVTPLSHPAVEGEEKSFHLGAVGFAGFAGSGYSYLRETAVLSYDPNDYTIFVDTIDPFTGQRTSHPPQVIGNGGVNFYLGEPNTGPVTKSDTLKVTESLPGDVDDYGNPVDKILTLTLSDRNDETRLRQNAEGRIPAFENKFAEGYEYANFYVDDNGYAITRLQYRWKVNSDPNLTVTWDVQFTPYDGGLLQHEVHQWVTHGASADPSAPYLIDPRYQQSGANGYYDVILLQANLAVDGNRDGQMSFNDPFVRDADKTTSDKPYRFWLNDDDDTAFDYDSETGRQIGPKEEEQVPPAYPDYSLHHINSKRNLEDFARLWIDLSGATDALDWGMQIGLKWKNVTGAPAINIYPSADGDGSSSYVTDDAAAQSQITGVFNDAVRDKNNQQTVDANGTFIFKPDYWNDLPDDNPKKCLLFEGASEGKGELTIVFLDQNGHELAEVGSVWIDIKEVRKLYERGKITLDAPNIPDPWNDDRPNPLQWAWDPWNWEPEVDPNSEAKTIVYVHGWRMNYDEYLSWADTTFKRLSQLGYKGRFYSFNWPTFNGDNNGPNPIDLYKPGSTTYNASEYRAWLSGPALADFINRLPNSNARYLLAHSMGNVVAGAALRSGMQLSRYAMCNSAMAAMAYDSSIVDDDYETPDTDSDAETRSIFGLANKFNPVSTEIINFTLPADYALAQWNVNNEFFKPQPFINYNYYYHSYEPPGRKLTYEGLTSVRLITSVAEAMGYVTRSRSHPAGIKPNTRGSVVSFVNMGPDGFNFGTEHSAEWDYSIQKTSSFWKQVLVAFRIDVTNQ